jgi:hypothetical protein
MRESTELPEPRTPLAPLYQNMDFREESHPLAFSASTCSLEARHWLGSNSSWSSKYLEIHPINESS